MELFDLGSSILIVAAHPDDETLGMGGTIKRMTESGCHLRVLFMSDGVSSRDIGRESLDARRGNCMKALAILGVTDVHFLDYPDNLLDSIPILELAKQIEKHLAAYRPKWVFTHYPNDLNVDHKAVAEATQVACRPKLESTVSGVMFFEVPSSTDWDFGKVRFSPNLYVDIADTLESKCAGLSEYGKEINTFPNARSIETLISLAKVRGSLVGFTAAEGFEIAFLRL
jgi:LmbE family N-acetylglucosaminyl deacetylase